MRVTFFGVRGSIPTPGPSTVRYGGNSVCVAVRLADDTRIVLDADTGIRECGKQIADDGHTAGWAAADAPSLATILAREGLAIELAE